MDLFVITEGDHTHAGDPKPMTLEKTISDLGFPTDKIVIEHVKMPNRYRERDPWVRERMQRDAAAKYIQYGDVAFFSDCDEVWNPDLVDINTIRAVHSPEVIHFTAMWNLMGRADLMVGNSEGYMALTKGPFIALYHHVKQIKPSDIREAAAYRDVNASINGDFGINYQCEYIMEGGHFILENGWHFSWMGGNNRMELKSKSFAHAFDEIQYQQGYLPQAGGHDPLGRTDHFLYQFDVSKLPNIVFDRPHLKQYFLPEN